MRELEKFYVVTENLTSEQLKELYNVIKNDDVWIETRNRLGNGILDNLNNCLFYDDLEWIGSSIQDAKDMNKTEISLEDFKQLF